MSRRFPFMLLLIGAFVVAGCGGGESYRFAPVEGTLKVKGKAIANIMVTFCPDSIKGAKGPTSSGITDEQGHYTLTNEKGEPGAVVGPHRVLLEDLDVDRPFQGQKMKNPPRIPSQLSVIVTALEVNVQEGNNSIPLNVPR
jgi:hypothetical protein